MQIVQKLLTEKSRKNTQRWSNVTSTIIQLARMETE